MILVLGSLCGLFILITLTYFLVPKLSFVPFFPTNSKDLPMIVEMILNQKSRIKNLKSIVIDLGAGTGTVIFPAAREALNNDGWLARGGTPTASMRRRSTSRIATSKRRLWNVWEHLRIGGRTRQAPSPYFIAVEIHPTLVLWMHLRRFLHPNRKNIRIARADMFSLDWAALITDNPSTSLRTSRQLTTIYLYVSKEALDRLRPQFETLPSGTRILTYMYEVPGWQSRKVAEKKGKNSLFEYKI